VCCKGVNVSAYRIARDGKYVVFGGGGNASMPTSAGCIVVLLIVVYSQIVSKLAEQDLSLNRVIIYFVKL
jgi:hypothetical protein